MMIRFLLAVLFLVIGCANENRSDPEEVPTWPESPPADLDAYQTRLMANHLHGPYVVSKWDTGDLEHLGEAIIWSGIAMASMPCHYAIDIANGLIDGIMENDGQLARIRPLVGPNWNYLDRGLNFDGTTGFYYGWSQMALKCPEIAPRLAEAWALHQEYVDDHDGYLWPNHVKLPGEFSFTRDAIGHYFGQNGQPHEDRLRLLETQIFAWVTSVWVKKAACYRVNLALLHLMTIESLGYSLNSQFKEKLCSYYADSMQIPTFSYFCGDSDPLHEFVRDFEPNQWEMRHQRCGSWEQPDGKQGLNTPALDYIWANSLLYEL